MIDPRSHRILAVHLHYGVHGRGFDLSAAGRPILVAGPNGSGKSTLLEGVVRTLFGFHRHSPTERQLLEARRPWSGERFEGRVELWSAGVPLGVRRRFDTDEVVVTEGNPGRPTFEGEARPHGRNTSDERYRRILEERFGLRELGDYERTAYVRQGELVGTSVGEEILKIAAGGHAAVKAALPSIEEKYYELTREPIREGASAKRGERRKERIEAAIRECAERFREARTAEERRRPLLQAADEARRSLERVDREIGLLESVLPRLAGRQTLEERCRAVRLRHAGIVAAVRELAEARPRWQAATRAARDATAEGAYPVDFEGRAGALETLWQERGRKKRERAETAHSAEAPAPGWTRALGVVSAALVAAGGTAWLLGEPAAGTMLLTPGLAGGLTSGAGLARARMARRSARERLAQLDAELAENALTLRARLEGVPEADTLTADTLPDRLRVFRAQREAREELGTAGRELEEALGRARAALEAGPSVATATAEGEEPRGGVGEEAGRLLNALTEAEREAAVELVGLETRLAAESADMPELPSGVQPTPSAVGAALETRRRERRHLAEAVTEREVQARTRGRPAESPVALEKRLEELRRELDGVEREARARRLAYRLLADAYEEFRERDQARLLETISLHLEALSGGELGPLHTSGALEETTIRAFERDALSLASPPLSFGQLHAALLAVRLGAVDFLAGAGIHVPLLVDEPFAHLDPRRATEVWGVLRRVARQRQVIVATQDSLLLERLGVEPDIRLPEPAQAELDFGPRAAVSPDPSSEPA